MSIFSTARRGIARVVASTALAVVALGAGTAMVLAYPAPPASGTLAASCSTVQPGSSCPLSFKFLTSTGQPSVGATVTFTVGGVLGASVSPGTAVTNASGVAGTTLTTGSGCGTATVTATSGTASVQAAVTVACSGSGLPLPNTSTGAPHPSPWAFLVAAVAALVIAGGAITLRQTRRTQ